MGFPVDRFSLYHTLPVPLQNVLVSIYGWQLHRRRYGAVHKEYLRRLLESERFQTAELMALQTTRLARAFQNASQSSPCYGSIVPRSMDDAVSPEEVLRDLPLLGKAEVQAEGDRFRNRSLKRRDLVEIHTGGTTGRPLCIFATRRALKENYAFFERQKRWAGIGDGARVATFAGRPIVPPQQDAPPFWRDNLPYRQRLFSSYHLSTRTVDAYRTGLRAFRPDLIDSYPSSLEPIARRIIEAGDESIRPKAIITSSETLNDESRTLFQRAFGCPVYDHYGSAEMVAFITQCSAGSYHVNPEYGVVELLDETGTPVPAGVLGEIVATGFVNEAMPLIRYRMGDLAMWEEGTCECGRSFPRVSRIHGRIDDVVVTPDGRRIGRLDPIFKAVASLHEARIVQLSPDQVVVELVATEAFSEDEAASLKRELALRLGPLVNITIARVDSIPRTRAGKLRMVERRF